VREPTWRKKSNPKICRRVTVGGEKGIGLSAEAVGGRSNGEREHNNNIEKERLPYRPQKKQRPSSLPHGSYSYWKYGGGGGRSKRSKAKENFLGDLETFTSKGAEQKGGRKRLLGEGQSNNRPEKKTTVREKRRAEKE